MSDSVLPTPGRVGPKRAAPEESQRAYAVALRHSRRVRFFKRAIPLGAVLGIGTIAFIGLFDPFRRLEGLKVGPITLNGTKITMELPKLTGFRKDARPYELTATAAVQDIKSPSVIELKDLKARITLEGTSIARLEALTGVYDSQGEKLALKDDVHVRTDSGYDALLKSAKVDFKAGTVVSQEPVHVTMTNGVVDADTLDIADSGKTVAFRGNVRTVMESSEPPEGSGGAPKLKGASKAAEGGKTSPLGGLGRTSKEPVKINSERLDIFDKDKKAVFSGKVVTVQGETTMRCTTLTVFYEQGAAKTPGGTKSPAGPPDAGSSIRKFDCAGPVDVRSKDQVATGDNASYDKEADKVYLIGNAKVSQADNVTSGERITYGMGDSHAVVEGGRVTGLFTPKDEGDKGKPPAKPAKGAAKGGEGKTADGKTAEGKPAPFAGIGTNSKEPIKVDANKLDVFDKEKKAIFTGDVVAVQGETTMSCSILTVFYEQATEHGANAPKKAAESSDNGLRKLDCSGPVTVISKDQVGTGDNATYDKLANKIYLIGNAKLSQGQNVTVGERVVYDLTTSQAVIETAKPGERVKAMLTPGKNDTFGGKPGKADKDAAATAAKN